MQSFSFFFSLSKGHQKCSGISFNSTSGTPPRDSWRRKSDQDAEGMVSSSRKCNAAILGHLPPGRAAARRWMQSDGPLEDANETKQIERYAFNGS
jgi:hypothetical protein